MIKRARTSAIATQLPTFRDDSGMADALDDDVGAIRAGVFEH